MQTISYVWVANQNKPIPSDEYTYGMQNIIKTAIENPSNSINIYIDSSDETLSYSLVPNIKLPNNIHFIPIVRLVNECKDKVIVYFTKPLQFETLYKSS